MTLSAARNKSRLQFQSADIVSFENNGRKIHGTLVKPNPKTAHVIGSDGREYRVSYSLLTLEKQNSKTARSAEEVAAIAQRAELLLKEHGLYEWAFKFDGANRRGGLCKYSTKTISMALGFAQTAPEEEIKDTILHEIAHALVGPGKHHNRVWRLKAITIGCSGRTTHDISFTMQRYISQCTAGCWIATAHKRNNRGHCKRCKGKLSYQTFTTDLWNELTEGFSGKVFTLKYLQE